MSFFEELTAWVKVWDLMSIFYSILAAVIIGIILKWVGLSKNIIKIFQESRGIKKYKENLTRECSNLIVIGKRAGFTIADVYVDLDISRSDLNETDHKRDLYSPRSSYILVGGPGAGKSTTVKKLILDHLKNRETIPFFIRLREYHGYSCIEELILDKLEQSGFPNPSEILKTELAKGTLCILDGLDEIRPNLQKEIYAHINQFYSKYFVDRMSPNTLVVSCRKEAYRNIPLDIPEIWEVRPLNNKQIQRFAEKWPIPYPADKSKDTFWRDLGAAEKILELARSPLLLVGGLMQYTESNKGIPEERFEYLERVAKWLVADWATAQGHPADPYRTVYDRMLPKIAYYMHKNNKSELGISECETILKKWLPTYGFREEKASEIINGIATKTGILVREGGNNIVFVQFGLQEYFVSIELLNEVDIDDITNLNPEKWWREAILLMVAQQRDPSHILNSLFLSSPILAVAAIAECPTPPIELQLKAINICLESIDSQDKAIISAIINLIRKVKEREETYFLSELEKRLISEESAKSLVAISLATAGTPKATQLLAQHPELWGTCLKEVGYLSTSFENLLVKWIRDGNPDRNKAIDMVTSTLTIDRLNQLIEILPTLKPDASEYLSSLLLQKIVDERFVQDNKIDVLKIISECIPFAINSDFITNIGRGKERIHYHPIVDGNSHLIRKIIKIYQDKKTYSSDVLYNMMCNSKRWASDRAKIFISMSACICLISYIVHDYDLAIFKLSLSLVLITYLGAISFPSRAPPWIDAFHSKLDGIPTVFINLNSLLIGMFALYAFGYRNNEDVVEINNVFYFVPVLIIISGYLCKASPRDRYLHRLGSEVNGGIKTHLEFAVLFCFLIVISYSVEYFYPANTYTKILLLALSVFYLLFLIRTALFLFVDWRRIKITGW